MNNDAEAKRGLREQLQASRMSLTPGDREEFDKIIVNRLILGMNWHTIRSVHCYVPMDRKGEINSWPFLKYLWKEWPAITTAVPGPLRTGRPVAYAVDESTSWRETSIAPLPVKGLLLDNATFDLIVLPCLGFDEECYRLGSGQGYYDRLLQAQPQAKTIGLALSMAYIRNGLPHEQHDIKLQQIITEKRIFYSSRLGV